MLKYDNRNVFLQIGNYIRNGNLAIRIMEKDPMLGIPSYGPYVTVNSSEKMGATEACVDRDMVHLIAGNGLGTVKEKRNDYSIVSLNMSALMAHSIPAR